MSSSKVKGLLKGLRYISQIFDKEKEQEMQIGLPTDVKHVAHIGWDGPSVNSASWMNEFKTSPEIGSSPLNASGDVHNKGSNNSVKWDSEDSSRRSSRSVNSQGQARDLPELPKASRRQSTGSIIESPTKEKSDKPRQSRKSSKHSHTKGSSDGSKPTRQLVATDSLQESDSPTRSLPDIPKSSRRKKSKEASNSGGSSKSRLKAQSLDPNSDVGSPPISISKSRNKQRSFEEDGQCERGFSGIC